MASQANNYQCPACTGPLRFDATSGKLVCDYCDSKYEVAEIEKLYAEQEEKAKEEYKKEQAEGNGFDDSGMSAWGKDAQGLKSYSCPSCGAELICDDTTAATSCPYCGNPTVVPGQFNETVKPDLIIPFAVEKQKAIDGLHNHYKGKKLLPKSFVSSNKIDNITGVYVPFWLFDGKASGQASFKAEKSRREKHGNDEVIIKDHFDVERAGSVDFEKVPVDASSKMPSQHMDSIEPFNYEGLKEFSTAYMPGFLADKYDVDIETSAPRADLRFENSLIQELKNTVEGYSAVSLDDKNIKIKRGQVKYALLPVWMLSTKWNDKTYTFAMNGQTGKMVGDLPVDKGKLAAYCGGTFAILAVIMGLITCMFNGQIDWLWTILLPLIIAGVLGITLYNSMKSVATAVSAMHYVKDGTFNLSQKSDVFTHTTREVIHHDNNGPNGGPRR